MHDGPPAGEQAAVPSAASTEQLLAAFTPAERAVIMKVAAPSGTTSPAQVPAAAVPEDLAMFATLCRYFRGRHHLEVRGGGVTAWLQEIMYHENIRRSALLQLVDKFRELLIKVDIILLAILVTAPRPSTRTPPSPCTSGGWTTRRDR